MKLLLIDGSNLIFRAYYATERLNIKNKDGVQVNAIHTLISMLNKLIKDVKPTHIFIALDTGSSTFRHDMYPDYKGKRSETPESLRNQFPLAKELYEAMGIKFGATEKFEADDLIATYAREAQTKGFEVVVFSGDKDLLQLVDDNITVITPKIGFAKEKRYTPTSFVENFSFSPNRFIEYKALVGDSSDNIIGVPGIGDKTATNIINQFESMDDILSHSIEGNETKKIWKNLSESVEQVKENLELVTLIDNVDTEFTIDDFYCEKLNLDTFLPFLMNQGFDKYYTEFSKNITITNLVSQNKKEYNNIVEEFSFSNLDSNFDTFIIPIYNNLNYLVHNIKGVLISNNDKLYFIDKEYSQLEGLLNSELPKIVYNLKLILGVIGKFEFSNVKTDLFLAASLLDSRNFKKSLSQIAFDRGFTKFPNSVEELCNESGNDSILLNDINNFIENLFVDIQTNIESSDLVKVLFTIEIPLTKVLAKMEYNGISIDMEKLDSEEANYKLKLKSLEEELDTYSNINFNSVKQLSDYLFEELKLSSKGIKKTKNGFATDVKNLEKLKANLPAENQREIDFINKILEYRKIKKIHSTYLLGLKKHIKDSKIYPIVNQLLTETGRLSIIEPNIQNMPIRTDEGKIIRSFFNSGRRKYICAIDYSQVELRVIAHLSKEEHMINDFKNNLDIHEETAKKIFNKTEVTSKERSSAKAINFGIIYGMSEYGLAKQIGVSNEEARMFIEKYFQTYPNIKRYMQNMIAIALRDKSVTTEFGRKRGIPELDSDNKMIVESGKRIAVNTPVQGTAADIMKLTMLNVDRYVNEHNDVDMVMQIHDELVFYLDDLSHIEKLKEIFEKTVNYEIKLVADASYGSTWLDCK